MQFSPSTFFCGPQARRPSNRYILAIAAWLFDITFGKKIEARKKRKQALEEVRRKEAEVQQKWDMLRDTTAVHYQAPQ